VAGVGVEEAPAFGLEDGVEAGDEHVRRHVRKENFVGLRQHLAGYRISCLGDSAQDALGVGHHRGRRDPLAGDVADDEAHTTVRQREEVVEVPADRASWLVLAGDLPARWRRSRTSLPTSGRRLPQSSGPSSSYPYSPTCLVEDLFPGNSVNKVLLVCLPTLRSRIGTQPQRDVGRLHRLPNHSYQILTQRV